MSVVVSELFDKSSSLVTSGESGATRSFLVYDDDASVTLTEAEAASAYGVPEFMEPHPTLPYLMVKSIELSGKQERQYPYEISVSYGPSGSGTQDNPSGSQANAIGLDIKPETLDIWRTTPDMPADISNPSRLVDINGTSVDRNGDPITTVRLNGTLSVTNTLPSLSNLVVWSDITGTRNTSDWPTSFVCPFPSFREGKVLYLGPSIKRTDTGVFTITHTFNVDNFYHLRQLAVEWWNDGSLKTDAKDETNAPADRTATTVVWVQPFPEHNEFDRLGILW